MDFPEPFATKKYLKSRSFNNIYVICLLIIVLPLTLIACSDNTPAPSQSQNTSQSNSTGQNPNSSSTNQLNGVSSTNGKANVATVTPFLLNPTSTPGAPPVPANGGTLTGAVLQDAKTLDFYQDNTQTGSTYDNLLFDAALTRLDPQNLNVIPNAAASWNIDPKQKTVTFKLRDGLKWSDGQPLTSADYVWTYQQVSNPANNWSGASAKLFSPALSGSEGVESVTAPDAGTVVVKLNLHLWSFDNDILSKADVIQPLPQHIWQDKSWSDASKNPEILTPSVVSGPWKLKEWKKGDHITFVKNSNSTILPPPHVDTLTFKLVRDDQEALQGMKNNTIDFYQPQAANLDTFSQTTNIKTIKWTPASPVWNYIGINFRKQYLLDVALRQALAYATNVSDIIKQADYGLGTPIYSDVLPWSAEFDNSVTKYNFSIVKATETLVEAGFTINNGKLLDKAGQPLPRLKLAYNTPSQLHEKIANILQQNFKMIGIDVEFENFDLPDFSKFLADPASDYDLFLSGWQSNYEPESLGVLWSDDPNLNSGGYNNPKLSGLYANSMVENDVNKRRDIMFQIQDLESKDLPYIYLFAEYGWETVGTRIEGINPGKLGISNNLFTDWFIHTGS